MSSPLIALDPHGTPAVLSYDLPEPTSYRGRHIIELDVPEGYFLSETPNPPPQSQPQSQPPASAIEPGEDVVYGPPTWRDPNPKDEAIKVALKRAKDTGYFDPKIFPNIAGGNDPLSREKMRQVLTN